MALGTALSGSAATDGVAVGIPDGSADGVNVGVLLGCNVGSTDGRTVGPRLGAALSDDGNSDGCSDEYSPSALGASVGYPDGGGPAPTSWNASHPSRGCSQENLQASGGDGLFYCFATN